MYMFIHADSISLSLSIFFVLLYQFEYNLTRPRTVCITNNLYVWYRVSLSLTNCYMLVREINMFRKYLTNSYIINRKADPMLKTRDKKNNATFSNELSNALYTVGH